MPALHDVVFDTSDLEYQGESERVSSWLTPDGDLVELHLLLKPPDIDAPIEDPVAVRRFYRTRLATSGAILVALDTATVSDCPALCTIVKVPQRPAGMTYVGCVTLPFRDCSFVLKMIAVERGITGVRDNVVCGEMIQSGAVQLDTEAQTLRGWTRDPYDERKVDGPYPNLSEAEAFDARFPEHPLSRVRPRMRHVVATMSLRDQAQALPRFKGTGHWWRRLWQSFAL